MKTIAKIIELSGGMDRLKERSLRIENEPFMVLCIEHIGRGPRNGGDLVSVAHYWRHQSGDAMRDPDMEIEVVGLAWHPISFLQDPGIYQEAVFVGEGGQIMVRPKLVKDLSAFMKQWSRNLADQGFIDAAKKLAS